MTQPAPPPPLELIQPPLFYSGGATSDMAPPTLVINLIHNILFYTFLYRETGNYMECDVNVYVYVVSVIIYYDVIVIWAVYVMIATL